MRHTAARVTATLTLALAVALAAAPVAVAPALAQGADDVADEAEVQFQLGNEAYLRQDWRAALAHWFASNRLAPNRNVLFNVARAYEKLGAYVEAFRYYQEVAAGELSPDARKAVEEGIARVSPYVALLDVTSEPPGATLYVGRRELGSYGTTPRVLAMPAGTTTVILDRPGYEPYEQRDVKLVVGERTRVPAKLARVLGTLVVTGEPEGAQVRVEGPEGLVAATLPARLELSPGEHRVLVSQAGYVPRELVATVLAEQVAELAVSLERQSGALVVQADERDALILIDGKVAGFTPSVIEGVPTGTHEVVVSAEGFRPWKVQVDVAPDERVLVEAELFVADEVAAASRANEAVRDAPASVSLVPEREIHALGAMTLAEALGGERGTYRSNDGVYESLGVRGFAPFGQYGNRVLVQIDGHTMNDDWIGSSYIGFDLMMDLSALERIELVRGPGSALYGTGAFFGVINMVTHDRAPRSPAHVGLAAVSDGTFRGTGGVGFNFDEESGVWVTGGGLYGQPIDYLSPAREADPDVTDPVAHDVGGVVAGGFLGRAWWKDLTLQWYFNQRDRGIFTAPFETTFGDDRTTWNDRRAFVEVRFEPELSPWAQLVARLSYDHTYYEGLLAYPAGEGGLFRETYTGDWATLDLRVLFRPVDGLRITVGTEYQLHFDSDGKGSSAEDGTYFDEEHPFHVVSAFAVADYAPIDWFSVSAGARFDGWWIADLKRADGTVGERFLSSVNPRLALIFHPVQEGTLKIMGGSAFRAPSIYELTYWDGGVTQVQSPELDPELVYTGQVEYAHELPWDLTATAGVFVNSISNLIEQIPNEDGLLRYANSGEDVWTLGAEVELSKELRRGFMVSAQYSWQATRRGALLDGAELPNAPEHSAALKVVAPVSRPELLVASRLVVESGRMDRAGGETDPAVLWDLALSGTVSAAHLRYAAGVRNLLDWRWDNPVGDELLDVAIRQPGRTVFADLTFFW